MLFIGAIIGLTVVGAARAQDKKPNIVLIVSDDFGYGDAGVYGDKGLDAIRFSLGPDAPKRDLRVRPYQLPPASEFD